MIQLVWTKVYYIFLSALVAASTAHAAAAGALAPPPPLHAATITRSTTEEVSQSVIHSVRASKQAQRFFVKMHSDEF
jgi:hypothetical protein